MSLMLPACCRQRFPRYPRPLRFVIIVPHTVAKPEPLSDTVPVSPVLSTGRIPATLTRIRLSHA
ncbi:hypothetical protein [Kistimonas asteriae]|uniref:hypothetical protein n=1 Tax=Kistimonas asteriae TaxID=517724 RepID=UPI001BA4B65F|nr:hypothetical protein [Kistimonas asteriae]